MSGTAHPRVRRALVSGASIAGPALAFWLHRAGWDVTVVERARHVRSGGYPIDVRGSAAEITRRMGVYDEIVERRFRQPDSHILAPSGRHLVSINVSELIGRVDTVDVELNRGDLTRILYEHTRNDVRYVFTDSVAGIQQHPDRVDVTFVSGAPESYDVVVGADGIHSTTRGLAICPEERCIRHLGSCAVIYDLPDPIIPPESGFMYSQLDRTAMAQRSGDGPTRVFLAFRTPDPASIAADDVEDIDRTVRAVFAGGRWELLPTLLDGLMKADDLYFDTVSQIRLDRWSEGRVAAVGDAAFAPSFLSGQGTSLALVGAYVLATELSSTDDVPAALRSYEKLLREFAEKNQALALRSGATALPRGAAGLRARNLKLRAVPTLARLGLLKRLNGGVREASNDFSLDGYGLR